MLQKKDKRKRKKAEPTGSAKGKLVLIIFVKFVDNNS
jgi:hypothetical protein